MARFSYESLQGDNVLFKQGTQSALNAMLPGGASAGTAMEGAFYLTTDTHRLYIGRKVSSLPSPNPYNVTVGQIYPEEISTGIATVANTGALAQVQVTGDAHDGDFYYIKDTNVLAVFEENENGTGGSWQQINAPTGIASFIAGISSVAPGSAPTFSTGSTYVRVRESLQPSGASSSTDSDFWLKAGSNITLKPSAENNAVEISSANSQSTLTLVNSDASTNKAKTVLSDGINFDSNLYFVGASDTTATAANTYVASTDASVVTNKAYYSRSGSEPYTYTLIDNPTGNPSTSNYYEKESIITITGPGVKGTVINAQGIAGDATSNSGFKIGVQVQNGANSSSTSNKEITTAGVANSYLDPQIRVGENGTTDVHFHGGRADLPVYTITQTNAAIEDAVIAALKGVDALHYKGTVATASALGELDDGTLEIGDVYKASASFNYTPTGAVNQVNVKTGDILIAQGTEYALSADTSVNSSKTYYSRTGSSIADYAYTPVSEPTGNPHNSNYYEYTGTIPSGTVVWELVPSGDEPVLRGRINNTNTDGAGPEFGLEDSNIAAAYNSSASESVRLAKRPLNVQIDNTNSTLIKAASTGTSADQMKITLHHQAPTSGTAMTITSDTVTSASATDTLGGLSTPKDAGITFIALSSISKDSFGHITEAAGQSVTLKHNYLTTFNATHSVVTAQGRTYGQALIGADDTFGISNSATKAAVKISSDSLDIAAPNDNSYLNINLVWQNF